MKQTAKRILSFVLSLVMLVSMMTVFTFAANNYVPDDEYYDRIMLDSFVVNPEWQESVPQKGDKVTYSFRGKDYTETYDENIHFGTIQEAFDASVEIGNKNPIIVLSPGIYLDPAVITDNVTILGANAGIDPNVKGDDALEPWTENENRVDESIIKGAIVVKKTIKTALEVKFDGVTLFKGFAFIEGGSRKESSVVYCENTIISGAGNAAYDNMSASDVFSFSNAAGPETTVNIKNVLVRNMTSSNVVGLGIKNFNAENVMFRDSMGSFIGTGDGPSGQNPEYNIKNCMFYNNNSSAGVISIDHTLNDNASRTASNVVIDNCWFIDGPDTEVTADSINISPIQFSTVGPKNILKVTNCYFEGKTNYEASVLSIGLSTAAQTAEFKNSITFSENIIIGYPNLPNTKGMTTASSINFTGNYFATADFMQKDPVFLNNASVSNVQLDYYYINEIKTIKSSILEIKSFGIPGTDVDNKLKTVTTSVNFGEIIPLKIEANDATTTVKVYTDKELTNEIKEFDTSKFASGVNKNVFYAESRSTKYPSYSYIYTIYITAFDPSKAIEFNKANSYLLTTEVEGMADGEAYYNVWDGVAYKFIVGKNVFADAEGIFAMQDVKEPTILLPAGVYNKSIYVERSATILGAKHGINPNIPNLENPDAEWEVNPERSNADQETVLQDAVIALESTDKAASITVDGITFGTASGYADRSSIDGSVFVSTIKNCMVDGAYQANYFQKSTNSSNSLGAVINIGSGYENGNVHKTLNLINFRMTNEPLAVPIGTYMENIYFDGCYIANNVKNLFTNEITAPKDQDFTFEIYNSCFYKNKPTSAYFIANSNTSYSAKRNRHALIMKNNVFFETSTYAYGVFGYRFSGRTDYLEIKNNTFVSSSADSLFPGYENWFIGKSGHKAADAVDSATHEPITKEMFILERNRIIGAKIAGSTANTTLTSPETYLDYSNNYFASAFDKGAGRAVSKLTDPLRNFCNSYYTDYAMTTLNTASPEYTAKLDYDFYGADKATLTFNASADASATTYKFNYDLNTVQASVKVYTDEACTEEVSNPVALTGATNVFYVKFASMDESVSDVYTATITKAASTGATLEQFGSWKILDNSVSASIPVNASIFNIPQMKVSAGATAKMYNDAACTVEFTANKITVPSTTPVQKFIKVVSQDGSQTNIYSLTVVRGDYDQAELVAVENGYKTSATTFTVNTNASTFDLVPEISLGATLKIFDGNDELVDNGDGSFTVENVVDTKDLKVEVTSATGVTNTFTVTVVYGATTSEIISVANMNAVNGTAKFTANVSDLLFKVVPTLASDKATFKLYKDFACTKPVDNTEILLTTHTTTLYLKATSADGLSNSIAQLVIVTSLIQSEDAPVSQKAYEIKDAVLDVVNGTASRYTITVPAGTKEYTLLLTPVAEENATSTFIAYGDSTRSRKLNDEAPVNTPVTIKLNGRNTAVYLRVWSRSGETAIATDYPVVTIVVPQEEVTYADDAAIAGWAKDRIDYLNKEGFGYFVGDENGKFNPTAGISRFEVAVVISKIIGTDPEIYKDKRVSYVDNIPAWAKPYVCAVTELGIMNGKTQLTFNGADATTRQEFARIITSALAILNAQTGTLDEIYTANQTVTDYKYAQLSFVDEASVANWAKSAFKLAVGYYEVMSGSNEGGKLYLNPTKQITRQEVAVLIANLSGYAAQ